MEPFKSTKYIYLSQQRHRKFTIFTPVNVSFFIMTSLPNAPGQRPRTQIYIVAAISALFQAHKGFVGRRLRVSATMPHMSFRTLIVLLSCVSSGATVLA